MSPAAQDRRRSRRRRIGLATVAVLLAIGGIAFAAGQRAAELAVANRPYRSFETKPAIIAGPLVLDVSDTAAAVIWMTDAPSDARVWIGEAGPDREVVPEHDGMLPVGTLHRVVVDGLAPGTRYRYRVGSRGVVAMKPYWPDRGGSVESAVAEFTTLDPSRDTVRFAVISDTHEDTARVRDLLKAAKAADVDFVVHVGDSIDHADSELQVRESFFGPTAEELGGTMPLLYARGNHETRGAFARTLSPWLHAPEGGYYFSRRHGPLELFVVDTGEDKPDDTRVYAGLNDMRAYRARELAWFRHTFRRAPDAPPAAPFRVVLAHQPEWGWDGAGPSAWTQAANAGRVDLMIAGHTHRHAWVTPDTRGNDFPILVVGQDQVALVDADRNRIRIRLTDRAGRTLHTYSIQRRTR